MAGNRAMQFTCRDWTWYEMPLWAPGVTPEVVSQRAPLSQYCARFQVPIHWTWMSSTQVRREAGMVHIWKWDTSQKSRNIPINYGDASVNKWLRISDGLLCPWWNEYSKRSLFQRQPGTLEMHKRRKQASLCAIREPCASYFTKGPKSFTWRPK